MRLRFCCVIEKPAIFIIWFTFHAITLILRTLLFSPKHLFTQVKYATISPVQEVLSCKNNLHTFDQSLDQNLKIRTNKKGPNRICIPFVPDQSYAL